MKIPSSSDSRLSLIMSQSVKPPKKSNEKPDIEVVVLNSLQPGKRVIRIEIPRNKEREVVKIIEKALKVKADIRHVDF
ncbi:MAG: hypothetical protein J7M18_05095 [Candidatus Eremiobacteraeota bacterium]|nr:hypothetical protein [Candidatus Eremiobacteraeota bacterium]